MITVLPAKHLSQLYEVTLDENWLRLANNITAYTIQHFYNLNNGMFFYTSLPMTL